MWGTQQLLLHYAATSTDKQRGRLQPFQFDHLLSKADVSTEFSSYLHSFVLLAHGHGSSLPALALDAVTISNNRKLSVAWQPKDIPTIRGEVPAYCKKPSPDEDEIMQRWLRNEINARCHLTRLWVPCDRSRPYDAFIPCEQELSNHLADDYASSKGWSVIIIMNEQLHDRNDSHVCICMFHVGVTLLIKLRTSKNSRKLIRMHRQIFNEQKNPNLEFDWRSCSLCTPMGCTCVDL